MVQTSALSIAKEIGVNEKTIRNVLESLEREGLIETQSPILSPNDTPKKIRYKGRVVKLKESMIYNTLPKNKIRKKSDTKSDTKSDITLPSPDYISPPFVADEFREIWQRYMEYRKEIKKPYKSRATEKVAYEKMLKIAQGDPETAKDIIERAILGQWQGLYETKNNNDKRNNYQTNRVNPPRTTEERIADYKNLSEAVLRRIKARESQ